MPGCKRSKDSKALDVFCTWFEWRCYMKLCSYVYLSCFNNIESLRDCSENEGFSQWNQIRRQVLVYRVNEQRQNTKNHLSTRPVDYPTDWLGCVIVQNGHPLYAFWPSYHLLAYLTQVFHRLKNELHFENSLTFRDHRLVIQSELYKSWNWKTLARARTLHYWPNMNGQIKEIVKSCGFHMKQSKSKAGSRRGN